MTLDEFLTELRLHASNGNGSWEVYDNGVIRRVIGHTAMDCPVTAVCRDLKKGLYHVTEFSKAAHAMDLSILDAQLIVKAADNTHRVLGRTPSSEEVELRERLLQAVKLA